MAYLLDLLLPGLGHLGARRLGAGLGLLALWAVGITAALLAASFDLWALLGLGGWHLLLAIVGWVDLRRLRKQGLAPSPRALKSVALVVLAPLLAGALVFGIFTFLLRPITIRSGSMEPGIWTGNVVVVQLFWPWVGHPTLGDVVIVAHPRQQGRQLLKRIIGLAGDLIEVRSGEIFRNEQPLSQCDLRRIRDPESKQQVVERLEVLHQRPYLVWDQPGAMTKRLKVRVPDGHVFVLGDNRDRSGDSRSFGTVPIGNIRGRILVGASPMRNRIDQAPMGARKAAFSKCSQKASRGGRARSSKAQGGR